jgi:serine/threonine-protein kinase
MGKVYYGEQTALDRPCAVKVLDPRLRAAEGGDFTRRFLLEASVASKIAHPNVVTVFDYGETADGSCFIAMEYLDGRTLADELKRGALPAERATHVARQICRALREAHALGVVHRDVKPGNILRANDHRVKLADFGIAKATEQSSITQAGSVLGTAAYLAPEQGRGEEAGPPADVYALGVVAYQLLSGRLPFEGKSLTELALKQQGERPPALDTIVSGIRPELASAVDVALRLEPHLRYPTALDMGRALEDGARGVRPGAGRAIVPPMPGELHDDTEATIVSGRGREATVVAGADATRVVRPEPQRVQQREPRPGPPRRQPGRGAPQRQRRPPPPPPSDRPPHDNARLFALLAGIVAVVVIAVVIIVSPGGSSGSVTLPYKTYSQNAQTAVQQMQTTISDNQQ